MEVAEVQSYLWNNLQDTTSMKSVDKERDLLILPLLDSIQAPEVAIPLQESEQESAQENNEDTGDRTNETASE